MDSSRPRRRSGWIGYAVLSIALAMIAASALGSADRQRVRQFEFRAERPGKATGVETEVAFPGATSDTAVATIVTKLARGTDFDTSVPRRCDATDEELMAQGRAACPRASRVGDGEVELAELGSGKLTLFNSERETIFLVVFPDSGIRTVNREAASGRTQRIEIAEGVTLRRIELEIDRIRKGGEGYVETPDGCPDRGRWVNRGRFVYRDGVVQREKKRTRCEGPNGRHG